MRCPHGDDSRPDSARSATAGPAVRPRAPRAGGRDARHVDVHARRLGARARATCSSCGSSGTTSRTASAGAASSLFYLLGGLAAGGAPVPVRPGLGRAEHRRVGGDRGGPRRLPGAVPARGGDHLHPAVLPASAAGGAFPGRLDRAADPTRRARCRSEAPAAAWPTSRTSAASFGLLTIRWWVRQNEPRRPRRVAGERYLPMLDLRYDPESRSDSSGYVRAARPAPGGSRPRPWPTTAAAASCSRSRSRTRPDARSSCALRRGLAAAVIRAQTGRPVWTTPPRGAGQEAQAAGEAEAAALAQSADAAERRRRRRPASRARSGRRAARRSAAAGRRELARVVAAPDSSTVTVRSSRSRRTTYSYQEMSQAIVIVTGRGSSRPSRRTFTIGSPRLREMATTRSMCSERLNASSARRRTWRASASLRRASASSA